MAVNKVILIGNLGKDPEMKETKSNKEMCTFTIATEEVRRDAKGVASRSTDWHQIVAFGGTAKNCAKYLKKGSRVYVEGKLKTRKWEDKDGKKRITVDIVPSFVQFLDSKRKDGGEISSEPVVDIPW